MKRNKDIRDAIEWAERNLVGKSFKHSEISKKINFTKKGIKHAVSARTYSNKIKFIYSLPNALLDAELIDVRKDKKQRLQIIKVYVLSTIWINNGEKYFVRIYLREQINGVIYYDHFIIKKRE